MLSGSRGPPGHPGIPGFPGPKGDSGTLLHTNSGPPGIKGVNSINVCILIFNTNSSPNNYTFNVLFTFT